MTLYENCLLDQNSKEIYQWAFSGACAWEVQRSWEWRKASPLPRLHWVHFIQKVKRLWQMVLSPCLSVSGKLAYALCSVLKRPHAFLPCLLFVIIFFNVRHFYLGYRTTRKGIFLIGVSRKLWKKDWFMTQNRDERFLMRIVLENQANAIAVCSFSLPQELLSEQSLVTIH